MLTLEFATFAIRHNVPADAAFTLPAIFESAARKTGMPVRALLATATFENQALAEYLAGVAIETASKVSH